MPLSELQYFKLFMFPTDSHISKPIILLYTNECLKNNSKTKTPPFLHSNF